MAELNVQQQNLVKELRQAYPELKSYSDEQILTIYNQQLANVQLSEDERISIMSGRNGVSNDGVGLQVETTQTVELTKDQENELLSALTKRINDVTANTQKAEEENGFLGKAWNWAKNTPLLDWCTDSTNDIKKAQQADLKALESGNIKEAFKQITGLDYTVENVNKFLNNEIQTTSEQALNGYKEGQDMASDVVADIFSGIAAVGIYTAAVALAPVSGGASIAVGIAAATASGAAIKTGIKFADTVSSQREYTSDNLKRDLATGAFSGVLAPITGGLGGAVGKTVATKMGVQAVKQVGKEVADTVVESSIKQGIKTALTNPTGYEYVGGTLLKRSLAFGAEMATDGAIGGAVDNAFRTAYDGGSLEDVGNATVQGFVGGAIMSPIIGGGMKFAGKGAQKIFGKDNVHIDADGKRVLVTEDGSVIKYDDNPTAQAKAEAIADLAGFVQEIPPANSTSVNSNSTSLRPVSQWRTKTGKKIDFNPKAFKNINGFKPDATLKGSNIRNVTQSWGSTTMTLSQILDIKSPERTLVKKAIRFNDLEIDKYLMEIDTPFVKSNKETAKKIFKRIMESNHKGGEGCFYQFTDNELLDVLKNVNEKNINLLESMLDANTDECFAFSGDVFANILSTLSKYENETAKNVVNLISGGSFITRNIDSVEKLAILTEKFPEEMAILSSDFSPKNIDYFFESDWESTEALIEQLSKSSATQKELIKTICSSASPIGSVRNRILKEILNLGDNYTYKQLLTISKNYQNAYDPQISQDFERLRNIVGKELSLDATSVYKKKSIPTAEDAFIYARSLGVSETDSRIWGNSEVGRSLVHFLDFITAVNPENSISSFKKQYIEEIIGQIKRGNKDGLKEFSKMQSVLPYFTKENFEIYKSKNKHESLESTLNYFIKSMEDEIVAVECAPVCSFVNKLTGKKIYEHELFLMGSEALALPNLKEADIANGIKKLQDLNLLTEDSNILTMLARMEDLNNIELTPEIKDFAQVLSKNKNIEEGYLIELLGSIQGITPEIRTAKIDFIKKLLDSRIVNQQEVPKIIKNLSIENSEILQKQISSLMELKPKNSWDLTLYSNFLSAKSIEELDSYLDFLNRIKNNSSGKVMDIISYLSEYQFKNNKAELVNSMNILLDKKAEIPELTNLLREISKCSMDKQNEFMDLYMKGFDLDIGDFKHSLIDIISLHLNEIDSLNINVRLNFYDKINNLNDVQKDIIRKIGLDYDALHDKVVNSLGARRHLVQVPKSKHQGFIKMVMANNNPIAEKVLREFDFAQFGKEGIPLKYSRKEFNLNIENLLKELSEEEKEILLKHFGLVKGDVGFEGILNNRPFENKKVSEQARKIAQKIQKEIENFTINNEALISDKAAKEMLDGLIKGFPEFTSIVGKEQHGTHAYSVDIHTLKVLQSAMNNPLYKQLSDKDKTILKYSILLHDLGKKGGVVDNGHAGLSADYTWSILDRYPFPTTIKDRIIEIVDNHHWFEKYNTGTATAENIAVRCRRPEDLKIYEIFSKADFENVNENFHLGSKSGGATNQAEFDAYMTEKFKPIEEAVNKIYQKANLVFDTQFMHQGQNFPRQRIEINGQIEELKVLNFADIADDESLFQYGFAPNVTKENARFLVHMTEPKYNTLETVFRLTDTPVFQSTWSTSLIRTSNNRTYCRKEFGVILDSPQANFSEAFFKNSGSGYGKGLDAFQNFLFGSRAFEVDGIKCDVRHYVKNNFIIEMQAKGYDLNDLDYAALSQYLFNKKYLSQITSDITVGDKVIKAQDLIEALEKSRDTLFEGGDEHNEIIAINPKVKGVIAKVEKLEDCPQDLLKFAKEHDLPIILMKATDR